MSWLDTIFKMTPLLRRNTITPTIQNGQTSEMQCDDQGRLLVVVESSDANATLWADGGTAAATRVIKHGSGRLHSIFGRNTGTTDCFVFIYDSVDQPGTDSTTHLFVPVLVKAGEAFSIDLTRPRRFNAGLRWVASDMDNELSYDPSALLQISAEYE